MDNKSSEKTVNLDNTKITSLGHYRSDEMSDAARLLRKEQVIKRKLKAVLEINAGLEKDIKVHQAEIRDQRSGISFQLNDLLKELNAKFDHFVEERLERMSFRSNETSHQSLQNMMQKYQRIEDECVLLRKSCETLQGINGRYVSHAAEIEQLVLSLEESNREYQQAMEANLAAVNEDINRRQSDSQRIESTTNQLIKEIDFFVQGVFTQKQQQSKLLSKIQKLKKLASRQQQKVNEIHEWAEIVIDKNNRQAIQSTLSQKGEDLRKLTKQNEMLEVYLKELEIQEERLVNLGKEGKENFRGSINTSRARATPNSNKSRIKEERPHSKPSKSNQ